MIIAFGALLMVHGNSTSDIPTTTESQWNSEVFIKMIPLIAAAAFYMVLYLNRKMAKIRRKSGTPLGLGVSAILMLLFASFIYVI